MIRWKAIAGAISAACGESFQYRHIGSVAGGCINQCYVLYGDRRNFFVKLNAVDKLHMFEAEAQGLRELGRCTALRVPEPLCSGISSANAYLVLEYVHLVPPDSGSFAGLGHGLAALHGITATHYGWCRDNTIGETEQQNCRLDSWVEFYRHRRLGFQLRLAGINGYDSVLQDRGARLLEGLGGFFDSYRPIASLLHGDLWSGNFAADDTAKPVLFDPAVYYGDREADMAMTELFGGFGQPFYAAYNADWPLDAGYPVRKRLYNLYHVLNHLNLFGGGYRAQAVAMIDHLLAELAGG